MQYKEKGLICRSFSQGLHQHLAFFLLDCSPFTEVHTQLLWFLLQVPTVSPSCLCPPCCSPFFSSSWLFVLRVLLLSELLGYCAQVSYSSPKCLCAGTSTSEAAVRVRTGRTERPLAPTASRHSELAKGRQISSPETSQSRKGAKLPESSQSAWPGKGRPAEGWQRHLFSHPVLWLLQRSHSPLTPGFVSG